MARQMSEMSRFARLATLTYALCLCSYESTSITLSPLGMVSVCPEGQILLTCERISGSILYWDVSIPRPMAITRERFVLSQESLLSPEFRIGFTEFNITRTSDIPLTSQLLINNVTTEINVYCSEDGNETNAPMTVINVKNKDDILRSMDLSLNVTMVNQLLRSDDVTVTLQWPQEPGTVYNVNVSPNISHTELTNAMIIMINLTVSYNIQYNVSIVSSLCGITTTKVLKYVTCDYPPTQSLHDPVVVVSGSQDSPPIEGQLITYMCPPGFILTGPNVSVCTGNGEWEPDPGEVDCIADCGLLLVERNLKLSYSSTLEGSVLTLTCENETSLNSTTETILSVTCHSNGSWIPNPADFIQSCLLFSTTIPTTEIQTGSGANGGVIIGSVLGVLIFGIVATIITISAVLWLIKKGFLRSKSVNWPSDIQLENTYQSHTEQNLVEQPDPVVQQDTLVYADIGPSSLRKRGKEFVTLKLDDMDDRVEYALLNHSLQKPVITTNQDFLADDSLNLDTLLIQVQGAVTQRWYQLGEALEVSKDVLDKCSNYPPEESIVEVLDQWLRNFPGRPTWRDVANALRKIGLQQLANDIEMVYKTGKLPVQVEGGDSQQVFTTTALELPQQEQRGRKPDFNSCYRKDADESVPPLPPKPQAGSDARNKNLMSVPPRPPKYTAK